jgi:hypothetical protein
MEASAIDYDLHGIAGVRLLDAGAMEAAAVDRQLGGMRAPLTRAPDVVVRFVDHVEVAGPVRLLGADEAGFGDDAFVLLRGFRKARARVRIDVERLGAGGEIVAERGIRGIPLLVAAINLSALAHGVLPLHASAFAVGATGVLATGWSKGGKTEAMLAFMAHGARFVGDEWVYVTPEGRAHGLPEPIRLWDWHVRQLPRLRARVPPRERGRLQALAVAGRLARRRGARRVAALVDRQQNVDVAPAQLFDPAEIALAGPVDRVFLMRSWERPDVAVSPVSGTEVAARMAASLRYERAPLLAAYEQFRFAFPGRSNELIEQAPAREAELLGRLLDGRDAHAVDHPYPVRLDALFEAMRPHC